MEWASNDIIGVITYLLPGFFAAWVFHGLTAHRRESPFERIIQALVFTAIIQAITGCLRVVLTFLGRAVSVGAWTDSTAFGWSIMFALAIGSSFAWLANHNKVHGWLSDRDISSRTSYPSEWFAAFNSQKRFIILHFRDRRRLYGWPYEWPDHPDGGHFRIVQPAWLLDDGSKVPLHEVQEFLVPVSDIGWVEFMKEEAEVVATPQDRESAFKILTELQEASDE